MNLIYLFIYIVVLPLIVIIAVMLIIAATIACKRKKGHLQGENDHTFVGKGVPFTLTDQLDNKPDQTMELMNL